MKLSVHEMAFDGALLARGFWLYVWEITRPDGAKLYYARRTGDPPPNMPQSPFNRMSHHLGPNHRNNTLRSYIAGRDVNPEACLFRLLALGPLLKDVDATDYRVPRDIIAALEKALADAMLDAGYDLTNRIKCRKPLDSELFAGIWAKLA